MGNPTFSLLRGTGGGGLAAPIELFNASTVLFDLAQADINGDGKLDFVAAGAPALFSINRSR